MQRSIETVGDVIIVNVSYKTFNEVTSKDLREDLEANVESGAKVLLDLSEVEFVDSAGLGVIAATVKRLRANGGELKICHVASAVRALFELVRMHKLVDIFNDRDEALRTF